MKKTEIATVDQHDRLKHLNVKTFKTSVRTPRNKQKITSCIIYKLDVPATSLALN